MGFTDVEKILIAVGVDISEVAKLEGISNRFGNNQKIITKSSQASARAQKRTNEQLNKGKKLMDDINKVTKRFRMELLSVMFGAAALSGAILSMLTPSFELVGAFETLTDTLGITFLGTALQVEDWLLGFQQFVFSFDPQARALFGDALLWTGGFMAMIAMESQLKLFFDGLTFNIEGLTTGLNLIKKAAAFTFLIKGVDEIVSKDNLLSGLSLLLSGIGFTVMKGGLQNLTLGAALAISVSKQLAYGGSKDFLSLLNDVMLAGFLGWKIGGVWGAGLGVAGVIFLDTMVKDKGLLSAGGITSPLQVQHPQPTQVPSYVSPTVVPNFNTNIDITTIQPIISIDWERILPDIMAEFEQNITKRLENASRR